jgi:hypothetical protein
MEVQNILSIKPITIAIAIPKATKPNNVLINVIVIVTRCIQVPKQQVLREHELMKAKVVGSIKQTISFKLG